MEFEAFARPGTSDGGDCKITVLGAAAPCTEGVVGAFGKVGPDGNCTCNPEDRNPLTCAWLLEVVPCDGSEGDLRGAAAP